MNLLQKNQHSQSKMTYNCEINILLERNRVWNKLILLSKSEKTASLEGITLLPGINIPN